MDTHSNPRRAVKSAQEQEDRRRGAETKETVLDVLQRQRNERLRKRREKDIVPGALLKLLVKDKLPHSRKVSVNAKEWQLKPSLVPSLFFAGDETS